MCSLCNESSDLSVRGVLILIGEDTAESFLTGCLQSRGPGFGASMKEAFYRGGLVTYVLTTDICLPGLGFFADSFGSSSVELMISIIRDFFFIADFSGLILFCSVLYPVRPFSNEFYLFRYTHDYVYTCIDKLCFAILLIPPLIPLGIILEKSFG